MTLDKAQDYWGQMSKKSKTKTMNVCVPEGALLQVCDLENIKSQKNIYVGANQK